MWRVNLSSGEATEREQAEFAVWYDADLSHRRAWDNLSRSLGTLSVVSASPLTKGSLGRRALQEATDRRRVLRTAMLGAAAMTSFAVGDRLVPLRTLLADHKTWTGEHKEIELPRGSVVILGPRSAVNLRSGIDRDRIELLAGSLLLKPGGMSSHAVDLALGDWLLKPSTGRVSLHDDDTQFSAAPLDAAMTAVIPGRAPFEVDARQGLALENGSLVRRAVDVARETSWSTGFLVIEDGRLAALVQSLRPYFVGVIRISPAAAAMRIAGVFKLREPRDTLLALSETLPIKVRMVTPFWLNVDM